MCERKKEKDRKCVCVCMCETVSVCVRERAVCGVSLYAYLTADELLDLFLQDQ